MRFQTLYEGRSTFAILFALMAVGMWQGWPFLTAVGLLGVAFCINFFRDPDRRVPGEAAVVVAAADGVVADIAEVEEDEVLKRRCQRVGIFLSVFDVHVNRAPIAGKVTYTNHFPGTYPGPYLDARNPGASKHNEALTWAFTAADGTEVVVRQITGAIARRIVPWSKVGDELGKGDRFGMIRFGSRTEIYLPLEAELTVRVGDRVRGAESIVARLKGQS